MLCMLYNVKIFPIATHAVNNPATVWIVLFILLTYQQFIEQPTCINITGQPSLILYKVWQSVKIYL
jgi:hypothetical protein